MVNGKLVKVSDSVSMADVDATIQADYYLLDRELKDTADSLKMYAGELKQKNEGFQLLGYQIYVAADLKRQKGPFITAKVAPGQGKTYIAALLIHEHS